MTTPIDLSQLPAPTIIDPIDFESLYAARKAAFIALYPADEQAAIAEILELESDPIAKLLEENTYRELLLRQQHNERAKSLLAAYASGAELDHIGVTYYMTERQELSPGDPDAVPPVAPTYESDADYLRRCLLAHDAFSTAGSRESYIYHALSAAPGVRDAAAVRPFPGIVQVYVLSRDDDGEAPADLVDTVKAALTAEVVRPLNDTVLVGTASIRSYRIQASLTLREGPDADVVLATAIAAARAYADERHALGADIVRDAVLSRLYVTGVERVDMPEPASDILCDASEAPYCTAIEVTLSD